MIEFLLEIAAAVLLVVGALFALVAAFGIIRLPDVYTRMHAAAKAGTVGSGLLLLATGLESQDPAIFARAIAAFVFFILTAPVSSHLLARAAHRAGCEMAAVTVRDDLAEDDLAHTKKKPNQTN
ncbi:monovalent cation/H(+) antiporter subunit G [Rhizobium sp. L1K21]|uniref:monovalent cation/H(+) antiporter subunit G n=1 Tax=Rhizobium sp. L1K21 TaxID=2954933 RepID=UPI0020923337|nr:monovalent cation/H(+) antiporter subunit G [Rhizobium sp. L1K21]MCO6186727.1 monovalent cation/H(+) antiporter subunit G [Rhizobium sp. L1K21]